MGRSGEKSGELLSGHEAGGKIWVSEFGEQFQVVTGFVVEAFPWILPAQGQLDTWSTGTIP